MGYLSKIFHYSKLKRENDRYDGPDDSCKDLPVLSDQLKENLKMLEEILGPSTDIIKREFQFGFEDKMNGALLIIDGLANRDIIDLGLMKPLMYDANLFSRKDADVADIDFISNIVVATSDVKKVKKVQDVLDELLSGSTIFLLDGCDSALVINERKWQQRGVSEPDTGRVVRGPREGFTETLRVNTAMLRRKIKNPNLTFEGMKIGIQTRTDVSIAYLKGVVSDDLVEEIKKRLNTIKIDAILESGYVEAFIEDNPYSLFTTVGNSEKPDTIAAQILEGRVAIFIDGTPFVLTAPMLFIEHFQSAEDYYMRAFFSSFLRIIRFIAYFITLCAPAIYVALTTFHQELIPTQLLFTLVAGHSNIPFPAAVEAAVMLLTFDILREAGIRLPQAVGSAISIVGALVLGESAVSAGLIGPFMVIVVAITAICSFVVPALYESTALLRYVLLILASMMGGFGILMGLLVMIIHLVSLRSFGTPFLSPIAPLNIGGLKDTIVRLPLRAMRTRPKAIVQKDVVRQSTSSPYPSSESGQKG